MLVLSDPFILLITLIVIVLVLIIGGIIAVANKKSVKPNRSNNQATPKSVVNINTKIHFNGQHFNVKPYNPVSLVRDYNNPLANYLIAVVYEGSNIGYVKSDTARLVAPIIDSGVTLKAWITNVIFDNNKLAVGCEIQISSM